MIFNAIISPFCPQLLLSIFCLSKSYDNIISVSIALIILAATISASTLIIKRLSKKEVFESIASKNSGKTSLFVLNRTIILVLNSLTSATVIYDKKGNFIFANNSCKSSFNITDNEQIPNLFESSVISYDNLMKLNKGEQVSDLAYLNFNSENSHKLFGKKLGKQTVIHYQATPITDPVMKASYFIITLTDSTDSYKENQKTTNLLYMLRDCINMTGLKAYLYNVEEDVYYSFNGNDLVKTDFNTDMVFKQIAPKYRSQYLEMFLRIKNGDIAYDRRQYPLFAKSSNRYYQVDTSTYGITDVSGNVTRILQTTRNITDDHNNQQELSNIKHLLSKPLPNARFNIWSYDQHNREIAFINREKPNLSLNELKGMIHKEDIPKLDSTIQRITNDYCNNSYLTIRIKDNQGQYRTHEIYIQSTKNIKKSTLSITGINCDVTDRYNLETEIESITSRAIIIAQNFNTWIFDYNTITDNLVIISKTHVKTGNSFNKILAKIHPDNLNEINRIITQMKVGGLKSHATDLLYKNSDSYIKVSLNIYAYLFDEKNKPIRYCAIAKSSNG